MVDSGWVSRLPEMKLQHVFVLIIDCVKVFETPMRIGYNDNEINSNKRLSINT